MIFDQVDENTCMHDKAFEVSDVLREQVRELYAEMFRRNGELQGSMANAVLAGLTLLWLESVHNVFGSMDYESALNLVRDCKPTNPEVHREMRAAARDFLRRSRWLKIKRRTK